MGKRFRNGVSPTGVEHSFEIEDDGNTLVAIEHTPTAVEQTILDSCAKLRSLKQNSKSHFRHAGRVDINTYMAWRKEWKEKYSQTFTWQTFEVMKFNSRDNAKLRTGYKRSGSMLL